HDFYPPPPCPAFPTRRSSDLVVDGYTDMGDGNEIFPFASIGLIPQDLKFRGEETRLVIGSRNIFREFVTIHRGTHGGGGETRIRSEERRVGQESRRGWGAGE